MSRKDQVEWLDQADDISITTFSIRFNYVDCNQAYSDFEWLIQNCHLKTSVKLRLLRDFESWKANTSNVDVFWLEREKNVEIQKGKSSTSTSFVRAIASELPHAVEKDVNVVILLRFDFSPQKRVLARQRPVVTESTSKPISESSSKPILESCSKPITEPPWHELTMVFDHIVNGEKNVTFPKYQGSSPLHKRLFELAATSLESYLEQPDQSLLKDAQYVLTLIYYPNR
ncbi:hypothetical protein BGZ46_005468 [Entomortierella lignicola]|nr:hypothetical protein BGZ46_005468 [Entomortierella lignicola]